MGGHRKDSDLQLDESNRRRQRELYTPIEPRGLRNEIFRKVSKEST